MLGGIHGVFSVKNGSGYSFSALSVGYEVHFMDVSGVFIGSVREYLGLSRVYFVSKTDQVKLRSGRV